MKHDNIVRVLDIFEEKGTAYYDLFVKDTPQFAKEFVKASRKIYKLISQNPRISAAQIAESIGLSPQQVQKYMKRLQDLDKIVRVGGRKTGEWKIIDEEYKGFFDRI